MIWINNALKYGQAVLSCWHTGKYVIVEIRWPRSHISVREKTLEEALNKLESKVMDVAAQEMIDRGAV